jgi:hypothetical protein
MTFDVFGVVSVTYWLSSRTDVLLNFQPQQDFGYTAIKQERCVANDRGSWMWYHVHVFF